MRAAVIHSLGIEPAFEEFPDPPADGNVAEVVAAALNPLDIVIAAGQHPSRHGKPPFVAGYSGVARLPDGSHRYFSAPEVPYGALAELVPLSGAETATVPDDLDPVIAAALGVSGVAAWLALVGTGRIQAGESVLVLGAGGQVGGIAVQAARLLGASRVLAVVRDNAGRQRALDRGADAAVLSGGVESLVDGLREAAPHGVDLILDQVWGSDIAPAIEIANFGARVVQVGNSGGVLASLSAAAIRSKMVTLLPHVNIQFTADERATAYEQLAGYAAAGKILVDVERVDLSNTASAWKRISSGTDGRKLVIVPLSATAI